MVSSFQRISAGVDHLTLDIDANLRGWWENNYLGRAGRGGLAIEKHRNSRQDNGNQEDDDKDAIPVQPAHGLGQSCKKLFNKTPFLLKFAREPLAIFYSDTYSTTR
jgi:hypothetical protein